MKDQTWKLLAVIVGAPIGAWIVKDVIGFVQFLGKTWDLLGPVEHAYAIVGVGVAIIGLAALVWGIWKILRFDD